MRAKSWWWAVVHAGLGVLLLSSTALAKSYKSGELETKARYGFGAFEARIRCAQGPGVISTFFLWKPNSEQAPAVPWHEIDFEMGQASGDYQTQIMTPGGSAPLYRTEHAVAHFMSARPYQGYFTYRIEWTPDYIAFFVDGKEVRRETDKNEYAVMFAKDANGDTPSSERMELRTGVWPGDTSAYVWSGVFDGSSVPTAHFVDYVKVWKYTPNQANKFATVLLDEQFNTLNTNVWYPAQWTFDFSASDYVSQNIGVRDGRLVMALTTAAGQGILPTPPADVPPPMEPVPSVPDGFVIEAEKYNSYSDTTPANYGNPLCSSTDVDAERTQDPKGGVCNIGWTAPTEWLQYDFQLPKADYYDVVLRLASPAVSSYLHLEVDGVDVSGPVAGPGLGWQAFADATVPGVLLSAGAHSVRLVFDTGDMNVNYLAFPRLSGPPPTNPCQMSCDDANPCTIDSCDSLTGCRFLNSTQACADDGDACTNDVCAAGSCTHPANNTCQPPPQVPDGFLLEAEKPDNYFDTSAGNSGSSTCGTSNVDAEPTLDPKGSACNVGWTAPGEWLEYDLQLPKADEYVVTLRIASQATGTFLHLEIDGVDVSGPVAGPGLGWQSFADAAIPGVFLSAGAHKARLVFDTGEVNVNYLAFARVSGPPPTGPCQVSCDDSNPCTTDSCDPITGCRFQNNTLACADDGNGCTNDVCAAGACTHPNNTLSCADDNNSCTNDVCSAGACTHPSNNTCTTGSTPCAGLCTSPVVFASNNYNSGNLGTGATCHQTTATLTGGVCGNLSSGRKLTVNGVQMSCTANWPSPLPAKRNGGYCVQTTAGNYAWAFFSTW
ncbi:MAG TPA: family 16 glycosylhydrolase [Polyangiaceae bacterium]|nr:family 16 glycosylhydrolase [Polyangiaceae bacterium]